MIAIPAGAVLRRQLGLVVLSCLGLWVLAFLACAAMPFYTPPSFLLIDLANDTDLLDLIKSSPSLIALDLHKPDQNWHHDTGNTAQHLLYALAAAAVPAEASINSRNVHQNATANARLRAVLQHPSDNAPAKLCQWLKNDVPAASISPQQSVLLAGLLTSNEALMPHYILQLLEYLSAKPAESVFVSIYESGSTDRTGLWLAVLAELLSILEVPHHIQTGGSTRQEGEDRIGFLARVRNKVLEPLWWPQNITRQQVMQPSDGLFIYSSLFDNATTTTLSSSSSSSGGRSHSKQWLFRADKVVFLNDVYFCAQHVHRLLAHEGVNLACGLDHYQARTAQKLPVSWRMDVRGLQPVFLRFYDNWVARDSEGTIFRRGFNDVVRDAYGTHRMHQGLAFPVTCCWNGLAVFDAAPLQEAGLQFRSAHDDDCPASECSHFCEDLRRMGFDKMVVDPAVRLGYIFDVAAVLDKGKWQTFTPWSAAQHSPPDWTQVVHKPDMMCCPEPAIQACYRRTIYEQNIYERNQTS